MWRALRELPTPHRFRRQHPTGPFVVDFACPGRKLAIELDGGQHAAQKMTPPGALSSCAAAIAWSASGMVM
jgi:very-short-patch-repair endonuclease